MSLPGGHESSVVVLSVSRRTCPVFPAAFFKFPPFVLRGVLNRRPGFPAVFPPIFAALLLGAPASVFDPDRFFHAFLSARKTYFDIFASMCFSSLTFLSRRRCKSWFSRLTLFDYFFSGFFSTTDLPARRRSAVAARIGLTVTDPIFSLLPRSSSFLPFGGGTGLHFPLGPRMCVLFFRSFSPHLQIRSKSCFFTSRFPSSWPFLVDFPFGLLIKVVPPPRHSPWAL